ncbi:MAG: hypothetical protein AAF726_24885 [Planctomycetota bacterium]
MTRAFLSLLTLVTVSCTAPAPTPSAEEEPAAAAAPAVRPTHEARAANVAAYEREGTRLAAEARGQWVLIAHGEVVGHWPDFDAAWSEAERSASDAAHAYLYRAGIDDIDVTFVLSPFLSSDPGWVQMGRRAQRPQRLTIAAADNTWARKVGAETRSVTWGDDRARFVVTSPDREREAVVHGVASGLFQEDLTITEETAERLGLGRFEAPGRASYAEDRWTSRKVVARLTIPELEVDVPVVAYVLPEELTRPMWSEPTRTLLDGWRPDGER